MAMTTMTAVKSRLVTVLKADSNLSGIQITYGDAGEAQRKECIYLGDITTNQHTPETITAGRMRQLEDFEVDCFVSVQSKAGGPEACETRAGALADFIAQALADDPQLGGTISGLLYVRVASMQLETIEAGIDGPRCLITIRIEAKARLS